MIELTRLGQADRFFLNPDLIERIDSHVDTIVRLTNGVEYVVAESGDEIVSRIVDFRARVIWDGPTVSRPHPDDDASDTYDDATVVALPTNREVPR